MFLTVQSTHYTVQITHYKVHITHYKVHITQSKEHITQYRASGIPVCNSRVEEFTRWGVHEMGVQEMGS